MDEQVSQHFLRRIGDGVQDAIEDHEQRLHIPPPRRGRVQAIPFPDVQLSDVQLARAIELLSLGASLDDAADTVGAPVPALERHLAEWEPRWRPINPRQSAASRLGRTA